VVHTILVGVRGRGQYVGTYLAWGTNNNGWWGEGEVKFYLDGDAEGATICGTGTEDYFGGAWCFTHPKEDHYTPYSTPFLGFHQVIADGHFRSQQRFGMYRWHVMDLVRFRENLKVTIRHWASSPSWRNRSLPPAGRHRFYGLLVPDRTHGRSRAAQCPSTDVI
jgi:hypothetical protein